MKISLRKANALQNSINDMLKGLDVQTSVTLNEFEDVQEQIQVIRDRFHTNLSSRNNLIDALYEIRQKVAKANSKKINDMLAQVAKLEKDIGFNQSLAGKGTQISLKVLEGQINKNKDAKDDGYGYNRRDIVTSIFTEAEIEEFKREVINLKRKKQRLQDELLELNVHTEIELNKETVTLLKNVGIL